MLRPTWPNFFIVGAHKGGTTSLYEYLTQVPDIFMSKIKEPHYFAPNVQPTAAFPYRVIRDERKYLGLFEGSENKIAVGEASTSYLWDVRSPFLIAQRIPCAKIIMILRNPIERAFSHYLMSFRGGAETLSFYDALLKDYNLPKRGFGISNLYVELGLYSAQVRRYFEIFDKKNIKILIFEEFIRDTKQSVADVIKFLGVDSEPPTNVDVAYNSFFIPRNGLVLSVLRNPAVYKIANSLPPSIVERVRGNRLLFKNSEKPRMTEKEIEFLTGIYRDDISTLESILGRPLPWLK